MTEKLLTGTLSLNTNKVKSKLVTGTFILHLSRAQFNNRSIRTVFIMSRVWWNPWTFSVRLASRSCVLCDIDTVLSAMFNKCLSDFPVEQRLKIILGCCYMSKTGSDGNVDLYDLERHARRLCFVLNTERHKILLHCKKKTGKKHKGSRT